LPRLADAFHLSPSSVNEPQGTPRYRDYSDCLVRVVIEERVAINAALALRR
jgi:hypothetical protein